MIRDRKRTDAKDDAPRSVSRRSSSRDEDVVVVSARRFCLHHSVLFQSFFRWARFSLEDKALQIVKGGGKERKRDLFGVQRALYY